jgi:carboxyl-terminal processing protease
VRGTVKIQSVKYTDLEDGYAYVRLTSFIENSSRDFKKHIQSHVKKYNNVKGLVLDLRKNPGGLLDQAVAMSDFFLDKGIIVSTMDRNKKEKQTMYAKSEGTLEKFPMVILIDEYSASASEILAGARQDNKRSLIMGQKSFGKGSVQSVVRLGDGSGLKLTVARYYTPSGRSIQAEGIAPDVVVDNLNTEIIEKALQNDKVRREKDISGHLENESTDFEDIESESSGIKSIKNKNKNVSSGFMQMWWGGDSDVSKSSSQKVKLLKEDFQVLQAYNYLRAWKVMKGFEDHTPAIQKADVEKKTNTK